MSSDFTKMSLAAFRSQERWSVLTGIPFRRDPASAPCPHCAGAVAADTPSPPPNGAFSSFLLTDGTIMFQGNGLSDWYELSTDDTAAA